MSWVGGFVIALGSSVGFSYAAGRKGPPTTKRALFAGLFLAQWIIVVAPAVTEILHGMAGPSYPLAQYHRDFFLSLPLQYMSVKLVALYLERAGTTIREAAWRLFLRGLGAEWVVPEPEIRVWANGQSLNIEIPTPPPSDEPTPGRTVV